MAQDITVQMENGWLNFRVGAIVMRDGKILMAKEPSQDHAYSVGGRVQMGENTRQAVLRECREELGVPLEIDRLGFVHENFFVAKGGKMDGSVVYELAFFYYMKVPDDFEPRPAFAEKGTRVELVWIPIDGDVKYYPTFFRRELLHPSREVKHIVESELE